MNKVCSAILFLVAATLCNIEQVSALRGNGIRANDLHRSERIARRRNLKHGPSGVEPYELVAAHKGGLFGAVKKVAKKAKEKQEAAVAASVAAVNITTNATSAPTITVNETLPRDLPVFSLKFFTTSDYNPTDDVENYDELEMYLGEYLEDRMDEVFKETPGEHLFTEVWVDETEDPFTVDVYATANFKIPGQVPTHEYLVQQTKQAFTLQEDPDEYDNDFDYLIEFVRSMNKTNPFHKTVDIAYNPWEKAPEKTSDGDSGYWTAVFTLLGITAFFSFAIVFLYAFKKYRDSQYIIHDDPLQLHVVEPRSGINGMPYNDEESLRHVDAVRKQYSASNNLPEISLVEDPQDPQLEPSGSYEAPIYVGYRDDVEEEEEEESDSQGSDEYTEQVIEEDEDVEEEESVDETVEEEFTDEPQETRESNLGRFERLLGTLHGNESDEDETVEEEIIEDDDEEVSYDEQTVESEDLLNLRSVPVQLEPAETSQPVDPPQGQAEVATKDLFSMWENNGSKRTTAPVQSLNTTEGVAAHSPQKQPAQKSGLFSFWAIKAGESKDDDDSEEGAAETGQTEDSNDDESTEEHTLV